MFIHAWQVLENLPFDLFDANLFTRWNWCSVGDVGWKRWVKGFFSSETCRYWGIFVIELMWFFGIGTFTSLVVWTLHDVWLWDVICGRFNYFSGSTSGHVIWFELREIVMHSGHISDRKAVLHLSWLIEMHGVGLFLSTKLLFKTSNFI